MKTYLHSTRRLFTLGACTFALLVQIARSQDSTADVVGKITAKSASSISIATEDKKNPQIDFVVTEKTTISRGRSSIGIDGLEDGEMARVVSVSENGKRVATLIAVKPKS